MEQKIPIGAWVKIDLQSIPFVGFTYLDSEAGLSAKGGTDNDPSLAAAPSMTVRLPMPGCKLEPLDAEETRRLGLPSTPDWLEIYGPQPTPGTEWGSCREHPKLQGKFHPEYPDDIQVIVHDGGPRLTDRRPELVWVTVTACDNEVFTGQVLNQPLHLTSVAEGSGVRFVVPDGGPHPLMVTEKYLQERPEWIIRPCNKCGLSELLDAPSDLIKVIFPNTSDTSEMVMFTSFCGLCGGIQVVQHQSHADLEFPEIPPMEKKRWWQFWK